MYIYSFILVCFCLVGSLFFHSCDPNSWYHPVHNPVVYTVIIAPGNYESSQWLDKISFRFIFPTYFILNYSVLHMVGLHIEALKIIFISEQDHVMLILERPFRWNLMSSSNQCCTRWSSKNFQWNILFNPGELYCLISVLSVRCLPWN